MRAVERGESDTRAAFVGRPGQPHGAVAYREHQHRECRSQRRWRAPVPRHGDSRGHQRHEKNHAPKARDRHDLQQRQKIGLRVTEAPVRAAIHGGTRPTADRAKSTARAKAIAGGPAKMIRPPARNSPRIVKLPRKYARRATSADTRHDRRNARSSTGRGASQARGHTTPSPVDRKNAPPDAAMTRAETRAALVSPREDLYILKFGVAGRPTD